jgi:hypothetical protein
MMTQQQQPIVQASDGNSINDPLYSNAEINNDSLTNKVSPFQQKEGSISGLLGSGIRKRGRPRKSKEEIITKVEIIKKPRYKKFSHAKNSALDQLLEANEYNADKQSKKDLNDMLYRQTKMLKSMGF